MMCPAETSEGQALESSRISECFGIREPRQGKRDSNYKIQTLRSVKGHGEEIGSNKSFCCNKNDLGGVLATNLIIYLK
jgi:hypothetical protein